ncbi:thioredoxin-like domain-containing protein [Gaiella occulta]|uniref:Thioredoxin-like domain-containing protein n=1 Tax=Gaiella occulta TaxID=1002870 RepID=A0A7M2YZ61_9ACTN|nr:sucrase ferredoxin [Gaiella occulta]RDI74777.1 thioredoxin-like domain-containing protein [Gaiella occulta]
MSCSELSAASLERLGGTATRASRWLLVEVREAWGRDVVADGSLPASVRERLVEWASQSGGDGRVLFVRKPERRAAPTFAVFVAHVGEHGSAFARFELERIEDLAALDLDPGRSPEPVAVPTLLVCAHGRRDACCARLGVPLYEALRGLVEPDAVWQCSHLGGHRFAGNVLALPHGVMLGRVRPIDAARVAAELAADAVPLAHYRGRVIHAPAVQAAELAIRERLGEARLAALRYLGPAGDGSRHRFATPIGEVTLAVDEHDGPLVPPSCGGRPEPTVRFAVRWEGAAIGEV